MRTRFGEFVLDQDGRALHRGSAPVHLTPKAYALLTYLAERSQRAVSKSELLEHLWPGVFVTEAALTTVVKELRHALGDSAVEPRYIRGIRGFGYAFSPPSVADGPSPGPPRGSDGPRELRVVWQGREIALAEGENLFGRTHEAAVWVEDPSVSRRHAVLRVEDGQVTIEDCGSKNGTFVEGERVTAARTLEPGERFWLGQACLHLVGYVADQSTRSGA